MQRREKPKIVGWLVLSTLLHLCAAGTYLILATAQPIINDRHIIAVNIVQKGKHRDETMLPRLAPEEPKSEAPVVPDKAPEVPKATAPVEHSKKLPVHQLKPISKAPAKEAPHKQKSALDTLQRRLKAIEKQGNENAPDYGNSVTGELTFAYAAHVQAMLKESFEIPRTISDSEARKLLVRLRIKFSADGRPTHVDVVLSSKRAEYDDAVVTIAKSISSFGPPPLQLRKKLQHEGLEIDMCPYNCPVKD